MRGIIDPKSNKLLFNVFDHNWDTIPEHEKENYAFGVTYADLYYSFDSYKIGVFWQKTAVIDMDEGFLETWYYADKDFNTLLHKEDIGSNFQPAHIGGEANYYDSYGIYLQKVYTINKNNFLSLKLKMHYPKVMQYLSVSGYNTQSRFVGGFDYYYSDENYISKSLEKPQNPKGYGYGVDLEYIYKQEDLYIYAGLLNIGGRIHWSGLTKMHYDFDSKTIYKGSDGFNHLKPFGSGRYEYDVSYIQKMPLFYKASLDYQLNDSVSVGNNLAGQEKNVFNEPYVTCKVLQTRFKLGYIYKADTVVFGFFMNHLKLELSNKLGPSNKAIIIKLDTYF